MPKYLIFFLVCAKASTGFAQVSDFISVQKKNGRIIRNFSKGAHISILTTNNNPVEGRISTLRNDTLLIDSYQVGYVPTVYGVPLLDTVARYRSVIAFSEIAKIKLYRKESFFRSMAGKLLLIGGAGYLLLNVVNAGYLNYSLKDPRTVNTLLISAGALGAGFMLEKKLADGRFTIKKHRIRYVKMN